MGAESKGKGANERDSMEAENNGKGANEGDSMGAENEGKGANERASLKNVTRSNEDLGRSVKRCQGQTENYHV